MDKIIDWFMVVIPIVWCVALVTVITCGLVGFSIEVVTWFLTTVLGVL